MGSEVANNPNSNTVPSWAPADLNGLRGVDPQVIMERVAEGELLRDIAKDYGVSRAAVSVHIMRHADKEQWIEVKRLSAAARLELTESEFEAADDTVTLARVRDAAQHRRWRAEREHPEVYAAKPTTAVQINGDSMSVQVVSFASNTASPQSSSSTTDNRRIIETPDEQADDSHA